MTENGVLPDGWRWVRFGDVVRQVKETTKDPEMDGLSRIVGLEHLDSESLPLLRWHELDDLADGTSFTRTFRAGQVLFGKRRAYQRKVAVPAFDGVCSGDILVFEPATDELVSEFLPYIVQSDGFFDHALGTSAGSLSPRTKWQELAKYAFPLPPQEGQRRIARTLLHAGEASTAYSVTAAAAEMLWMATLEELPRKVDVREVALEDLCRERITYGIVQAGPEVAGGIPYIRVSDMTANEFLEKSLLPHTSKAIAQKYKRSACEPGDLVFALRGPIGLTRRVPDDLAGVNLTQGTARMAPDSSLASAGFLEWSLKSAHVQRQYQKLQKGSTFKEMSLSALRRVTVQLPRDLDQQQAVSRHLDAIAEVVRSASQAATDVNRAASSLREGLIRGTVNV